MIEILESAGEHPNDGTLPANFTGEAFRVRVANDGRTEYEWFLSDPDIALRQARAVAADADNLSVDVYVDIVELLEDGSVFSLGDLSPSIIDCTQ